jgi:hypothetical protein
MGARMTENRTIDDVFGWTEKDMDTIITESKRLMKEVMKGSAESGEDDRATLIRKIAFLDLPFEQKLFIAYMTGDLLNRSKGGLMIMGFLGDT